MKTKLVNDKPCLSIVNRKSSIVNFQLAIGLRRTLFLLLFAAMLFSCSKNMKGSNLTDPVSVATQNVALTGLVKDVGGNPLSGVNVTTGTMSDTTGSDGTFSFSQAGTVGNRAVIKFEKSGYFSLTRSGAKADEMYLEVMMSPKGNNGSISLQSDFDAASEKTLQVGGIKIELPASAFSKADGSAYSGKVRADVLNLGSGNANTALMMPGGDLATDKSDEMVLPIGMVDVVFTDNTGNLLKIKDNTNVKMTYAAPAGATNLPSSIPLWTFDEAKGIWIEEGSATLQGNAYTGTVSHFTKKGAGRREKTAIMQIHATECDNKPAAGAKVTFFDVLDDLLPLGYEFLYETYYTNSAGDCSVTVPKTWKHWTVNVSYKGENQRQAFTQGNVGKQVVYYKFENGCNGFDLRFDLIPGPTENSVIIKCTPAMPEPNIALPRYNPSFFLTGVGVAGVAGMDPIVTSCTGYNTVVSLSLNINKGGWNSDFTEYTYVWYCTFTDDARKCAEGKIILGYPDDKNRALKNVKVWRIRSITVGSNSAPIRAQGYEGH